MLFRLSLNVTVKLIAPKEVNIVVTVLSEELSLSFISTYSSLKTCYLPVTFRNMSSPVDADEDEVEKEVEFVSVSHMHSGSIK